MSKKGIDIFSKSIQVFALGAMLTKASQMGVERGVGLILVKSKGLSPAHSVMYKVLNDIERDPDPSRGKDDKGTNYFAVAMSKLAGMLSTGCDSGEIHFRPLKSGEVPYRGGIVIETADAFVYIAFSGGTEDEDVSIATEGGMTLGLLD